VGARLLEVCIGGQTQMLWLKKKYKLCDIMGCTYNMNVYLGKARQNAMQITTHATMKSLAKKVEGVGQKTFHGQFLLLCRFI